MWRNNNLARQLGIDIPLIQAPMAGGATTPALIAAVSNAGALGSLGAGYMTAGQIKGSIAEIRAQTSAPFAVNLFIPTQCEIREPQVLRMRQIIKQVCPELNLADEISSKLPELPSFTEQMQVIIDEKVPVFSFTFGSLPQEYIGRLKENNTIIIGTATNVTEAVILEEHGIDIIVVQGVEAGGHRGTFAQPTEDSLIGLMALVPQIKAKVRIPVVAAGGIMDASAIVAALNLGASGVQMGTAFLTTEESGIHKKYKEKLLTAKYDTTTLTKSFSGRTARSIKNIFIARMNEYTAEILDYPLQNFLTQAMRKAAATQNNPDFLALYAGQNACFCQDISAARLVNQLDSLTHQYIDSLNI